VIKRLLLRLIGSRAVTGHNCLYSIWEHSASKSPGCTESHDRCPPHKRYHLLWDFFFESVAELKLKSLSVKWI
jgi:hypothetical protein